MTVGNGMFSSKDALHFLSCALYELGEMGIQHNEGPYDVRSTLTCLAAFAADIGQAIPDPTRPITYRGSSQSGDSAGAT